MRFSTTASLIAAAALRVAAQGNGTTGELGDAAVVENNPIGAVYRATLQENPFFKADTPTGGPVVGEIVASTPPSGVGVMFKVNFQNLPKEGGPFMYHLHVDPVPADGNCTKTLAHLDPYIRGEATPCDAAAPATCQVGDLSGKHGTVDGQANFQASFWDDYVALHEGPGSFFGNRSIVLHFANKTRIACANFVMEAAGVRNPEDCSTTATVPGATGFPNSTTTGGGASKTTTTAAASATASTIAVNTASIGQAPITFLATAVTSLAVVFFLL